MFRIDFYRVSSSIFLENLMEKNIQTKLLKAFLNLLGLGF